ncbi:MAG: hypothetical protein FJ275_12420, partial [Planctomycetes bacterium]|nr:hypothetical protein [Planctomycetota bacterium]
MTPSWTDTWIGPRDAPIVVFNKGGRDLRLGSLEKGGEAPREFFYGYLELAARGDPVAMAPVSGAMPGIAGRLAERLDSVLTNSTLVGVRSLSQRLMARDLRDRRVLVGFTDGFSMSLGLAGPQTLGRAVRIGGFHCLSDIAARARPWARDWAHGVVARVLAGLDHAFFFGPADRDECVRRYGVDG